MARPPLGLLVDIDPAPAMTGLVRALATWCRPYTAEPTDPVAAWLASSTGCREIAAVAATGRPLAVWVADEAALRLCVDLGFPVAALVTGSPDLADNHHGVVRFPPAGIDLSAAPPLAPLIRARWRARLGLPEVLVVRVGDERASLPPELAPTGLAVASAVVARGRRWLLEAMARGAPCVSDAASTAALGVRDSDGVIVVEPADLDQAAADLARDERAAAWSSHAGRRFVERHHDCHRPTLKLARSLGLVGAATDPVGARIAAALDDLGTDRDGDIRRRALARVQAGGG